MRHKDECRIEEKIRWNQKQTMKELTKNYTMHDYEKAPQKNMKINLP